MPKKGLKKKLCNFSKRHKTACPYVDLRKIYYILTVVVMVCC